MKKKSIVLAGLVATVITISACGKTNTTTDESSSTGAFAPDVIIIDSEESSEESSEPETPSSEEIPEEPVPEGMYRSELTNEPISDTLQNQRPIAVMVDNEKTALDHFGVNQADIVYEMMNSTANGRITRLMVVMKDWAQITQLGSVRSVRPTNFMIAAEYNAILCHDGGPYYIDYYVAKDYTDNLSGGFARYTNGKKSEFTEYITYDTYTNPNTGVSYSGLAQRINAAKYSTSYTELYPGKHFTFAPQEYSLADSYEKTQSAVSVDLPFPHNESELKYNTETQTYDYYEYGSAHIDALDGQITTFKNVILQSCDYMVFDKNGYMKYYVVSSTAQEDAATDKIIFSSVEGSGWYTNSSNQTGYYLTNGEAIPITWSKESDTDITVYKSAATGEVIKLNTGKTYIAIVPSDYWEQLVIK